MIILVTTSVLVGWYIQVIRVEFYNELAWQELTVGTRMLEPADGASSSFALMFGWIPSLVLSFFIIGAQKLKERYAPKIHKNVYPNKGSH
ncbi:MAG: hypothetical protein N0C88_01975 [Candidatus Thiodiazotropha lotti]|uniref:Uncharacterized protein n=1 Tax=Candidatus Thiodiazotropha lotti TaxID=2792787 RepID=A0A9E4K0Z9_9GAMM|nr:hypothetical protein [Candidatus Thiodiazotropha lotti]MCG8001834.1 hypothetical protein [Candidatus Thiodiazotropha lotti]MCW4185452.1 hypothetical protein [Candidatus Thiodiazotropha lotti]MCW4202077.1 hypothetical protein [Candidatus Thiodiazotropha lotti]